MILSCQNISKSFADSEILRNVSFQINEREKFAIIGSNGAGKSTLLKIIIGELSKDSGSITFGKDTKAGYLAQYQDDNAEGNVYDIVLDSCSELIEMENRLREMEQQMSERTGESLDALMNDYHLFTEEFERRGGYTFRSEVTGVLKGLGFDESEFSKDLSMLSGGQKTRVFLGRLLVSKPDLLILDEPINHLDLNSIQWLETFLNNYPGAVIVVAHDRYFLDKIVDHVVDLSNHGCAVYKGNYTQFAEQKEQRRITMEREYENQQKEIAHQEAVIAKLKQFNREKSIKRAESRQKMLDKQVVLERPEEINTRMHLTLEPDAVSGNDVLRVEGLSKSFEDKTLFSDVSFLLRRGERLAILGDNGTGKTTLLKIINDRLSADSGKISLGSNVTIGYYDQAQQELDDSKTLFEEMSDTYPRLTQTRIRNVLAAFLFTGDDVFKKISALSGGERGRVSLAKLMLSGANLLILDEPTNHLDMESKEILEHALNSYTGTLLYVSHDRYFVNQTATRILELENESFTEYLGNYDYFVQKKQELSAVSNAAEQLSSAVPDSREESKLDWQEQKRLAAIEKKRKNRIEAIEAEIAELEEKDAAIEEQFNDPSIATNSAKLNQLSEERNEIQCRLEELFEEWENLSE